MRLITILLFLFIPFAGSTQIENKAFIGGSIGIKNYHNFRFDVEQHLLDGKYFLGLGYATDINDHLIQLKVGFRLFNLKEPRLRMYVYLPPYLNLNLRTGEYNTPFAFEVLKDFEIWKRIKMSGSIHTDIFRDYAIPQLRIRVQLFSWKGKK